MSSFLLHGMAQYDEDDDPRGAKFEAIRRMARRKASIYKTVEVFSGIVGRRLWVKNGSHAQTDGREIRVPFEDNDAYTLTEHEISHVLFGSDSDAKKMFIEEYSKRIVEEAKKRNVALDLRLLQFMLGATINIIEDYRCESLWGVLYPGSFKLLQEMAERILTEKMPKGPKTFLDCFLFVTSGLPVKDKKWDRFVPLFEESCRKVFRRGFETTLATAKWLTIAIVDEFIRKAKDLPPPPPVPVKVSDLMKMLAEGKIRLHQQPKGPSPDGTDEGDEGEGDPNMQGKPRADKDGDPDGGDEDDDGTPQPIPIRVVNDEGEEDPAVDAMVEQMLENLNKPYDRARVDAPPEERAQALADALAEIGAEQKSCMGPLPDDVQEQKYRSPEERKNATNLATEALKARVDNEEALEAFLAQSEERMQKIIEKAQQHIRADLDEEELLRREAMAKVLFKDKNKADAVEKSLTEQEAVKKLRSLFFRVMGKRKYALDDNGSGVDVAALIEQRVTKNAAPIFQHDERGRGFRSLVLIDRSGSMEGNKTQQAERACRIITKALKFPFVSVEVWGFNSLENGRVDITRYGNNVESFIGEVGGSTPLHVAVRLGARHLEQSGADAKQLIVITDGAPCFADKEGHHYNDVALKKFVRENVRKARVNGINVTGVMIGAHDPADLQFMFGSKKNWRIVGNRIADDLVKLVSTSFIEYLENR